jgi:hypothetical protein
MATKVYDSAYIELMDGTELYITPLKIRYLREFMDAFQFVKTATSDDEAIFFLTECARIAMKQYYPTIQTISDLEDSVDLKTVYKIIEIAGGISIKDKDSDIAKQASEDDAWENLDLVKLETEIFQLGIWKDYEDLEMSMSMPELVATLGSRRELEYQEKKFLAAIQGVDLDKSSGKKEEDPWERIKAKAFSKGKATSGDDILAFQGANASKAGFGIGMGLGYEDLTQK